MNGRFGLVMCAVAQLAVAPLVFARANAQQSSPIGQGSWIISGSAGLSRNHDDATDQTATFARLSPTGLLFVRPRLAIGGALTLGYSSTPAASFMAIGLGPTARYYFGDMTGQLFPFLSVAVIPVWQESNAKNTFNGLPGLSDATNRIITMDGSVGLTRLVATHVGLTGEAYYTRVDNKIDVGSNSQTRNSFDVGLRFGITVFVH
jgi:outer membrane protein W